MAAEWVAIVEAEAVKIAAGAVVSNGTGYFQLPAWRMFGKYPHKPWPVHITIRAKGSLVLSLLTPDWVEMRKDIWFLIC